MMTSLTNHVSTLIILIWLSSACTMCPLDCLCRLDEKARRRISCFQGGLVGSIPTIDINKNTQVLEIRAPPLPLSESVSVKQNWLAIGSALQSLVNLEELHIVQSNIPEISRHAFWGLKKLEMLSLMGNNISVLHDHNFRGLANLKQLFLDGNQISQLVSGGFKYLTDLRVLSLAKNRLHELDARVFEKLANLHRLNLSGNKFKDLYPEVFMDIQELRVFECRQCALRNINTQIYHLVPHLESLDLGDNDFFYLRNDEFHDLRQLRHLWLDGNHLAVVLEQTFVRQRQLEMVSLARNRLAKVTSTAFVTNNNNNSTATSATLTELDLSYNKLMRIDADVFRPIEKTVARLDLSGNNLLLAELNLQSLTNLEYLGLADMNLSELPSNLFVYHRKLASLNLSGNLMESIGIDVHQSLRELDLSRNKLRGLDDRSLDKLGRVQTLHLGGNPWSCDVCHMLPILNRIRNMSDGVIVRNIVCASPLKLRSRQLHTLHESDLVACHKVHSFETSDLNFFSNMYSEYGHVIIIIFTTAVSLFLLLFGSIAFIRAYYFSPNTSQQQQQLHLQQQQLQQQQQQHYYTINNEKKNLHERGGESRGENVGQISFKFPLELCEKKSNRMIATIDDITTSCNNKETRFSNGDL